MDASITTSVSRCYDAAMEWALLAVVLGLGPTETPVQLHWEAPVGCPDADAVMRQIDRFVPVEQRDGAAPLRAEGRLHSERDGFRLHLVVRGDAGYMERTLEGDDCTVLASAAALVVAVMVEPATVLEEVESTAAEPQAVTLAPPSDERPERSAPPTSRPGGFVAARGLFSWGGAPGAGGAVALGGGIRFARWRIVLEALIDLPRHAWLEDADAGARIGLGTAALRGCHTPGGERVEVPLCAGFEAGAMWARGFGLAEPRNAVVPWGAFALGTGLAVIVHRRVAVRMDVEGVVPMRRPRFVIEDRGAVYRPAPIGARAGAALEIRFP
jgi:hypothetical protein